MLFLIESVESRIPFSFGCTLKAAGEDGCALWEDGESVLLDVSVNLFENSSKTQPMSVFQQDSLSGEFKDSSRDRKKSFSVDFNGGSVSAKAPGHFIRLHHGGSGVQTNVGRSKFVPILTVAMSNTV